MRRKSGDRIEWRFYVVTRTGSKQVSAYGRTITELKAERKRLERLYELAPERITLNELLDRYIDDKRSNKKIDQRKVADTVSRFDRLIRPELGRLTIGTLCMSWAVLGDHFRSLCDDHPNSYIVRRVFDELRAAFSYAVARQLCAMNPILQLERPQYAPQKKRQPFTLDQVLDLLIKSMGRDRVIIAFLVMTGVRTWSEMSGLRVRDCNFLKKTVKLNTFIRRNEEGKPVEKPEMAGEPRGKTDRAEREIPLIDPLVDILEPYVRSAGLGPDDYLFPNKRGGLLRDNNWRRRVWKPLSEAVGRPEAVPYELRHTTNTLLAALGVGVTTRAAICGHSTAVNEYVYTKSTLEAKREALGKLGVLFPKIASTPMARVDQESGTEGAA